jgi:hypothetical protein
MRANHPIGPHDARKEGEGLGFVVEVRGRKNRHGKRSVDAPFLPPIHGFVDYIIAFL